MRKQHPWTNAPICRIDVTGFLSIMVVLLALFWAPIASRPDPEMHTSVAVPHARNAVAVPEARREDAMTVTILRDGRMFFAGQQLSVAELTAKLSERLQSERNGKVFLNADRRSRYRDVASSLAGIRAAGAKDVVILTYPR